jgi:hypothetical protein
MRRLKTARAGRVRARRVALLLAPNGDPLPDRKRGGRRLEGVREWAAQDSNLQPWD